MNFVQNWIRNVILIILLAHFIELLLPDNKLKKYVKVVIGFFVIIVILTPLLQVTTGGLPSLDFNLISVRSPSFDQIVEQGKQLRQSQQQKAGQAYQQKLSQQIEAVTKLNSRLNNIQVEVKLAPDNSLQQVLIVGNSESVKAVKAGQNSKQQKVSYDQEQRLQDIVATLYGLTSEQVKVKLK